MPRTHGRNAGALRPISLERSVNRHAEGSCLVAFGATRVLCTASVIEGVPPWRQRSGLGWLTAEYAMLPRATEQRSARERRGAGGRTSEIQRLIGRSLRAALADFTFGPRTIQVDCDVLDADGGTRTAAITGGAVALADACAWLAEHHGVPNPWGRLVAAVSVGVVEGDVRLDLEYAEDARADVDANIVMAAPRAFIEVQGTAERAPFSRETFDRMLALAEDGIQVLLTEQERVLAS